MRLLLVVVLVPFPLQLLQLAAAVVVLVLVSVVVGLPAVVAVEAVVLSMVVLFPTEAMPLG